MEFPVSNAPFAAYLTTSKKLNFLRIEATPKQAILIFDDPNSEGPQLELSFLTGTVLVPPALYNTQLRAVRRMIEIKLAEARKVGDNREQ